MGGAVKNTLYIIAGVIILASLVIMCDRKEAFEPDPSVNTAASGRGIYINESDLYNQGIGVLFINEGDTVSLIATSILLNKPKYTWVSDNQNVLKLVKDANTDTIVYAIATGDSGTSTTLEITDSGNNNAYKSIPVYISKYWADPARFSSLGSFNGHVYYISNDIKTWAQADLICQEAGGHLVTITSLEENTFLDEGRGNIGEVWIGVRFTKNAAGTMVVSSWVTGEAITYKNFIGSTTDPGIFAEYYFYMDVNGQWESWHEISYNYFLEME
jgi:hypothetical protein